MLIQAIRGPLMLITLGALLATDQAGKLDIGRTWPVLLILYGVLRLAERAAHRATGDEPPRGMHL
ncbi:MAG: hypothetical protein ABI824_04545 [Acidobacteriota bacterium]